MSVLWGYSDFLRLLNDRPLIKDGLVVDTNVLISATYDSDASHEMTAEFLDLVQENHIPLFCNVNVRAEFLEIHRRIIFTEAILDFEAAVKKSELPSALVSKLNSLRTTAERRKKEQKSPIRMGEADLKDFKLEFLKISDGETDLWSILCENRVGNKLSAVWEETVSEFGLNFLSLRKEDQVAYIQKSPEWDEAVQLMEKHGLSSSDAMILNMFLSSGFDAIVTSDADIAISFCKTKGSSKVCFAPDKLKKTVDQLLSNS